jgi:thiol-disulfide isomerase/thioredoxin
MRRFKHMRVAFLTMILISALSASAQNIEIIKFPALQSLITSPSPKIHVINFWATWCAPCVKELPLFEKLNESNTDVKVTLINLDFADKLDKVNSFAKKKNLKSEVFLLDEVDYNSWIDKVDKNWGGAIPATLVINSQNGKRKFIENELKEGELEKIISELK